MSAGPPFDNSAKSWLLKSLTDEAAREGDLSHLMHESQLEVLGKLTSTAGRFVMETGRRWGKTYFLLLLAFETCLRNPGCRVVYGAPTLKHLTEFILPAFNKIRLLLPEDIRPVYSSQSSHITFPNGAWTHLFGCDDQRQADTGVGSDAAMAIFDECGAKGMASLLKYVITSIFRPSLMTTGGRVILGSSPARTPDHEFTHMCELAEATGNYANRTIYDNPRLTNAQRDAFIAEDAADEGLTLEDYKKTDTFQREYMAKRVIDKMLVVLPKWHLLRETQRVAIERPEFFDAQVVIDWGGMDPHAAHFAYWHFQLAAYVIEDEVLCRDGENSLEFVEKLKAKELELWGTDKWVGTLRAIEERHENIICPEWIQVQLDAEVPRQPRVRWADNNNNALCRDFHELHGYSVVPVQKDTLELMTNRSRVLMEEKKVLVHPRCVHTDRHFTSTTWSNHNRNDFSRKANEHGDFVATLNYGVRHLDRQRNPAPLNWGQPERRLRPQLTAAQKLAAALKR